MRHEVSASGDAFQFVCGGVWWGGEGKLQEESAESSWWWWWGREVLDASVCVDAPAAEGAAATRRMVGCGGVSERSGEGEGRISWVCA